MVFSMYDPKLLEGVRTIHFIGCGGSGTYPLIQILHSRGFAITGSDVEETKNTEAERALGVRVAIGHDAANLGNPDLVVYSAAIHNDNPELQAAHARGIKAVERSVMLGYISRTHSQSIGVAGTHGKTTTTGMITTMLEHNSVLRPLYEMEERGAKLTIIKADKQGNFSLEDMEAAITPKTKAIVCTNGSNLTGNYVDVAAVGEMAHRHGVLLIVDASQTAGVFPIDVQKMNIDVLCFTGHKGLLAPQGTGGLYVREGLTVRPLLSGGSGVQTYNKKHPVEMPTALEAGTLNGHGIAGMNAALAYLEETGIDTIREREQELMWKFYEGVKDIPNVTVYGDFSTKNRCAIVALNIGDYDSAEVSDELLTEYGISTRPGGHCAPLAHEALGNVEQGAVRFSFSHYNTDEEIETAIRAIEELAQDEE